MLELTARHSDIDPIKEIIIVECLWEALVDALTVLDKIPEKRIGGKPVYNKKAPRIGYVYALFQTHYLNYWETHWNSLETGVDYPFTIEEIFNRLEEEDTPTPSKTLVREMVKLHRICIAEDDDVLIVAPQSEVW